jgi:hypothetical protein
MTRPFRRTAHSLGTAGGSLADLNYRRLARSSAPHAARCVARHGVRSHAVPVALVGECSMPVV